MSRSDALTKSQKTRARILAAARALFAARGYAATTVRDIAAAAGADAALVNRYFGGKDGLFARATEIRLNIPDLGDVAPEEVGAVMVRHFLSLWEDPATGPAFTILLRSAVTDAEITVRLREVFAAQVMPALAAVAPSDELGIRSGLISSQLLGLALTRHVLALPPVTGMDRALIEAALAPTIQRYATGPLPG